MICEKKKLSFVQAMNLCGRNGRKTPLILKTSTKQRLVFSLNPFLIIFLEETAGWVAHIVVLDVSEKINLLLLPKFEPRTYQNVS